MPNYEDRILRKDTRSESTECNCFICAISRYKGYVKIKNGRGHHRDSIKQIDASYGLYVASNLSRSMKVDNVRPKSASFINVCKKCFQVVGKKKRLK